MKKFVDTIQDPKEQTEIEAYIKDLGPADIGQFSLGFSHGRQWEHDKRLQPKADPKEKELKHLTDEELAIAEDAYVIRFSKSQQPIARAAFQEAARFVDKWHHDNR